MINLEISKGMYIRTEDGYIGKCIDIDSDNFMFFDKPVYKNFSDTFYSCYLSNIDIKKASFNIIDLIEYMDLLEIESPVKLYGENKTVALFNPVRCDGFTEFEDGTHCIILNLDYLVDVKNLKIKSVLTKEQFNSCKYVVERDK